MALSAALGWALDSGAGFGWHAGLHAALFAPLVLLPLPPFRRGRRVTGAGGVLAVVVGAGVLSRFVLLAGAPVLSDDVYRVIWEGRVVASGGDPWAQPPNDPGLAELREAHPEVRARVGYWMLPAIYPPAHQLFSAAVAAVSTDARVMKGAFLVAEGFLVWALLGLLRRRGLPDLLLAGYLWNPLPLTEIAGSGHGEGLAVALLALGLLAFERGRPGLAGGLAALSGMVKYAGFAALPFLLRAARRRRDRRAMLLAAGAAVVIPLLPFLGPERLADGFLARFAEFGGTLVHYARHWQWGEGLFALLAAALGGAARPVAFGLLAGFGLAFLVRRAPPTRAMGWLAGAGFLLTPTAHPWYLLWALPFLLLEPARRGPFFGCLLLSLTAVFSYGPLWTTPPGEAWVFPLGLRLAEYLPVALVLIGFGWLSLRERTRLRLEAAEMSDGEGGGVPGAEAVVDVHHGDAGGATVQEREKRGEPPV